MSIGFSSHLCNSGWFFFLKEFYKKVSLSKIFLFNHSAVYFFHIELLSSTRRSSQPVRFRTYILISNLATARVCNFFWAATYKYRQQKHATNLPFHFVDKNQTFWELSQLPKMVDYFYLFLLLRNLLRDEWKKCWKTWECKYGRPAGKAGHANGPPGVCVCVVTGRMQDTVDFF